MLADLAEVASAIARKPVGMLGRQRFGGATRIDPREHAHTLAVGDRDHFRQQVAPLKTVRYAVTGDPRLVKRHDASTADAEGRSPELLCSRHKRFGIDLGFVALAQID